MARRTLALTALAALLAPLAAVTASQAACSVDVTTASTESPHVTDDTGDWDGVATGNESGTVPAADLYREGIDLTGAWLARAEDGTMTANIEVVSLSALQPNAIFYMLWHYAGTDAAKEHRWVSGRLKGYDVAFTYGFLGINDVTGNMAFFTEGETTGEVVEGSPGRITVDIPSGGETLSGGSNDDWGAPPAGATLTFPTAESRFLLGTPEPMPPNATGFRHGFVYVTDVADISCDATIPA
ncbi:MAG TPA: hypothetical protein VGB52_08950 [Actinomycetota bacterium]